MVKYNPPPLYSSSFTVSRAVWRAWLSDNLIKLEEGKETSRDHSRKSTRDWNRHIIVGEGGEPDILPRLDYTFKKYLWTPSGLLFGDHDYN